MTMTMTRKLILPLAGAGLLATQFAVATDFTITGNMTAGVEIVDADNGTKTVTLTPGTAVTDQLITTLQVECNLATGYIVKLRSQKQSVLEDGSSNQVSYQMKYNNTEVDLTSPLDVIVEDVTAVTTGFEDRQIHLSVAASALEGVPAGNGYSDTITFAIDAK